MFTLIHSSEKNGGITYLHLKKPFKFQPDESALLYLITKNDSLSVHFSKSRIRVFTPIHCHLLTTLNPGTVFAYTIVPMIYVIVSLLISVYKEILSVHQHNAAFSFQGADKWIPGQSSCLPRRRGLYSPIPRGGNAAEDVGGHYHLRETLIPAYEL